MGAAFVKLVLLARRGPWWLFLSLKLLVPMGEVTTNYGERQALSQEWLLKTPWSFTE
jgi:hypothetical protein